MVFDSKYTRKAPRHPAFTTPPAKKRGSSWAVLTLGSYLVGQTTRWLPAGLEAGRTHRELSLHFGDPIRTRACILQHFAGQSRSPRYHKAKDTPSSKIQVRGAARSIAGVASLRCDFGVWLKVTSQDLPPFPYFPISRTQKWANPANSVGVQWRRIKSRRLPVLGNAPW